MTQMKRLPDWSFRRRFARMQFQMQAKNPNVHMAHEQIRENPPMDRGRLCHPYSILFENFKNQAQLLHVGSACGRLFLSLHSGLIHADEWLHNPAFLISRCPINMIHAFIDDRIRARRATRCIDFSPPGFRNVETDEFLNRKSKFLHPMRCPIKGFR